jgi:hypothetical protein
MKRTTSALALISALLIAFLPVSSGPSLKAVSEAPTMQWSNTYLGAGGHAIQTSDGGYAIASMNASITFYPAWERATILVKTDSSGGVQWRKTFEDVGVAGVNSVVQTNDGGYALSGSNIAPPIMSPVYSGWLIKTDDRGNVQWNKTFGPMQSCHVIQASDGGYVLVGIISNSVSSVDAVFLKTDAKGNVLWDKTQRFTGNSVHVFPMDVVETDDGGYAVAGVWKDDFWLMKTDSDGNLLWNKTYDPVNSDKPLNFQSVSKTMDGGYVLAGMQSGGATLQNGNLASQTGDFAWLVKVDSQGNVQWSHNYLSGVMGFSSAVQTSYGGYVAVGAYNRQAWLVRTDASGNLFYNVSYGDKAENESSYASTVVLTSDGGFAVSGALNNYSPTSAEGFNVTPQVGNNVWLAKFTVESLSQESPSVETPNSGDSTWWKMAAAAGIAGTIVVVGILLYFRKVFVRRTRPVFSGNLANRESKKLQTLALTKLIDSDGNKRYRW